MKTQLQLIQEAYSKFKTPVVEEFTEKELDINAEEDSIANELFLEAYALTDLISILESEELTQEEGDYIYSLLDDGNDYEVIDLTNLDEEVDVGKLPVAVKKHLINKSGGKDSEHEVHGPAKSFDNLSAHIGKALKSGVAAVVHVDGKPITSLLKHDHGYGRPEHNVIDKDGATKNTHTDIRKYHGGSHKFENPIFNAGDAKQRATFNVHSHLRSLHPDAPYDSTEIYKQHKVEVHSIGIDKNRVNVAAKRKDAKLGYGDDNLTKIKDSAALKVAKKVLGTNKEAKETAENLHKQIGKHIESGDFHAAKKTAEDLHTHLSKNRVTPPDYEINSYAGHLKGAQRDAKSGENKPDSWNNRYRNSIKKDVGVKESVIKTDIQKISEAYLNMKTK